MEKNDPNLQQPEEQKSYRSVTRGVNSQGNALAACLASVFNTLITYPLDVVKTRFQVHDGRRTNLPKYKGTYDALRTIAKDEGIKRGLYSGATVGMMGAAVAWSTYMFAYSHIKDELERGGKKLGVTDTVVASFFAGIGTMLITNPFWVIKTRLQVQVKGNEGYTPGVLNLVKKMAKEEGMRGFYRGLLPSLVSSYHGSVQFATYESTSTLLLTISGNNSMGNWIPFFAGAFSKVCAQLSTLPLTVIRARLQEERALEMKDRKYKGAIDAGKKIWKNEGFFAFYKGFVPSMWRLALNSAMFFYFFEHIKLGLGYFDMFIKK